MPDMIDDAALDALAKHILSAKRVLIAGYDRSYLAADQLHRRLLIIGVDSQSTSELGIYEPVLEDYADTGLVLFFTVRDNMRVFGKHTDGFAIAGVPCACITCTPALPFKSKCTHYITIPQASRNPLVPFLDDDVLFFAFIEVLIDAVAKHKASQEG